MLEPLETRRLLTLTNWAAIEGSLSYDLPDHRQLAISTQPVCLYRDGNGNQVFDGGSVDPLVATRLTDADGTYRFDGLTAGAYFVVPPPEPSGEIQPPPAPEIRTILISPADAGGTVGLQVDQFDTAQSLTAQLPPLGTATVSGWVPTTSAVGEHRKVVVRALSGEGRINVEINESGVRRFSYSENVSTSGDASVVWDGTGGDPEVVNPTGLGGVDLTAGGGQDAFVLNIHSTQLPPVQTFVVYTDATHASYLTQPAPAFTVDWEQVLRFRDFVPLPGCEAADFENVGALEFRIQKDPAYAAFALDYDLDRIDTIGPTVFEAHFTYTVVPTIDIEKATNGLDADTPTGPVIEIPSTGTTVTWTYVVTNPGNVPLANVVVTDDNGTPSNPADDFQPEFMGGDEDGDGRLAPDESWQYLATGEARVGLYGNLAQATGVAFTGDMTQDRDPSHYFGFRRSPVSGQAPLIVLGPDKSPGTPQTLRIVDGRTWQELADAAFVAYEDDYVGGTRVAVADLDGDGLEEIITAPGRNRAPEVRVFTWDGTSLPGFPAFLAYSSAYLGGVELTVADVNGDGKPDILTVPSYGVAEVRVFLNRHDGSAPSIPAFAGEPDVSFRAFPVAAVGGAVIAAADMGRMVGGSFVNETDGRAEIVVGTGPGVPAQLAVYSLAGNTPVGVQTLVPFAATNPGFQGGVSLAAARLDPDSTPTLAPADILVGMGTNGTSRIEIWKWNVSDSTLSLRGAIPGAFAPQSDNAPVRVAALDENADGLAETILAVQGPIGTTGEVRRFPITATSPFQYHPATPLTGFPGPWFIAASIPADTGSVQPRSLPQPGAALVWTNTANAYDVNTDGAVSPLDVLEVINFINRHPATAALPAQQVSPPRFFDSNADGAITPADALCILNTFNVDSPYSGEGEPRTLFVAAGMPTAWMQDFGREESRAAAAEQASYQEGAGEPLVAASVLSASEMLRKTMTVEPSKTLARDELTLDDPCPLGLEPLVDELATALRSSTTWLPDRS